MIFRNDNVFDFDFAGLRIFGAYPVSLHLPFHSFGTERSLE